MSRTLELCQAVYGQQDLKAATCHLHLALAYAEKGENKTAIDALRTTLQIRTDLLDDQHPLVGRVHYYLGQVYLNQQSFDSAIRCTKRGLIPILGNKFSNSIPQKSFFIPLFSGSPILLGW